MWARKGSDSVDPPRGPFEPPGTRMVGGLGGTGGDRWGGGGGGGAPHPSLLRGGGVAADQVGHEGGHPGARAALGQDVRLDALHRQRRLRHAPCDARPLSARPRRSLPSISSAGIRSDESATARVRKGGHASFPHSQAKSFDLYCINQSHIAYRQTSHRSRFIVMTTMLAACMISERMRLSRSGDQS